MNILLIQRDGIDLHHTLFASETSRMILRFYQPKKKSCGVSISCATLGSALSLVSELRWYIRRYMREALFEWENGIWFTHQLAQDVYYERTAVLGPSWPHRRLYGFREGKLITNLIMSPGSTVGGVPAGVCRGRCLGRGLVHGRRAGGAGGGGRGGGWGKDSTPQIRANKTIFFKKHSINGVFCMKRAQTLSDYSFSIKTLQMNEK